MNINRFLTMVKIVSNFCENFFNISKNYFDLIHSPMIDDNNEEIYDEENKLTEEEKINYNQDVLLYDDNLYYTIKLLCGFDKKN